MNTFLYISMVLVFFSYVGMIWIKYGIQKSISDSYYRLPERVNILFTFFCWGFAIPAIIIGSNVLMFLAGTGIAFVGAAAAFKNKLTRPVHMIGAVSAVILSQLSILIDYHLWLINILFLVWVLWMLLFKVKNNIWYIEILAFLSICITFLLKHFVV